MQSSVGLPITFNVHTQLNLPLILQFTLQMNTNFKCQETNDQGCDRKVCRYFTIIYNKKPDDLCGTCGLARLCNLYGVLNLQAIQMKEGMHVTRTMFHLPQPTCNCNCNCNCNFLLFIRSLQGLSPPDIELVNKYNIEIYLQNTRIQDKI